MGERDEGAGGVRVFTAEHAGIKKDRAREFLSPDLFGIFL
jgi:hypothetical protein